MSHTKLLSVERHPHMRDSQLGIQDRIEAAVTRIAHGNASMRIPVEATDPDIVLTDCGIAINRLEGERDELVKALRKAMDGPGCELDVREGFFRELDAILAKYPEKP